MSDVADKFMFYESTAEGNRRKQEITEAFVEFAQEMEGLVPRGREFSVMMTKLEEAAYFAKAGVSRNLETR